MTPTEYEERISQLEAQVDHLIEANKHARKAVPKDALYSHIDWLQKRLRECQESEAKVKKIREIINDYYSPEGTIDVLDQVEDVIDDGIYH
jgi:hypothetical protein